MLRTISGIAEIQDRAVLRQLLPAFGMSLFPKVHDRISEQHKVNDLSSHLLDLIVPADETVRPPMVPQNPAVEVLVSRLYARNRS